MPSAWLELAAQVPTVTRTHTESRSRANRPAVGPCAGDSGSGCPDAIGQAACPGAAGPARCWRLWFWRPPCQVRVWDLQAVENPPCPSLLFLLKTISGRIPYGPTRLRSVSPVSPCAEDKHCSCCCLVAGYCCVGGIHVLSVFGNPVATLLAVQRSVSIYETSWTKGECWLLPHCLSHVVS